MTCYELELLWPVTATMSRLLLTDDSTELKFCTQIFPLKRCLFYATQQVCKNNILGEKEAMMKAPTTFTTSKLSQLFTIVFFTLHKYFYYFFFLSLKPVMQVCVMTQLSNFTIISLWNSLFMYLFKWLKLLYYSVSIIFYVLDPEQRDTVRRDQLAKTAIFLI